MKPFLKSRYQATLFKTGTGLWPILLIVLASVSCREHEDDHGTEVAAAGHADPHAGHNHGPTQVPHEEPASGELASWIPTKPVPAEEWCGEHGVPESLCTRCNSSLIEQFKARGDWCSGHDTPESQCLRCNPELRAKWEAIRPKTAASPNEPGDVRITRRPGTQPNDPLCPVEGLVVELADASIAAKAGLTVELAAPRRISAHLQCPATITFDQRRLAHVSSRVRGTLVEVQADLGAEVHEGDVLAVVDSPTLGEARSAHITAREDHLLAAADAERTQAIARATRQMLELCTPDTSAEQTRERIAELRVGEAKGRLLKAHAALDLARSTLDRLRRLHEQKVASDKDFETARAELRSAEAEFHATRETIVFDIERQLLAAERTLKIAASALASAERRLTILGVTPPATTSPADTASAALSRYEVRSPLTGRVVQLHAVAGEAVDENDVIFTVADVDRLWAMLDVPERDLGELTEGQRVLFIPDGLDGISAEGRITWISAQVNDRTRTIKARAELPDGRHLLRDGMFGTARVVVHENEEVLTVPAHAIQTDGCCQLVFVKTGEHHFEPRKVVRGSTSGDFVEIVSGIAAGDAIATTGSFLLKTEILKDNIGAGCCEVEPGR